MEIALLSATVVIELAHVALDASRGVSRSRFATERKRPATEYILLRRACQAATCGYSLRSAQWEAAICHHGIVWSVRFLFHLL